MLPRIAEGKADGHQRQDNEEGYPVLFDGLEGASEKLSKIRPHD